MIRLRRRDTVRHRGRVVDLSAQRFRRRRPRPLRRRGPWRKVGMLAVAALFLIGGREWLAVAHSIASGSAACTIARVVDGDTLKVYCPGRGLATARILGLDTPEVYSPSCLSEWALGQRATFELRRIIWGAEEVGMVFAGRDRYDRRLVRVWLDGRDVARTMVAAGFARPYDGGRRQGWCG